MRIAGAYLEDFRANDTFNSLVCRARWRSGLTRKDMAKLGVSVSAGSGWLSSRFFRCPDYSMFTFSYACVRCHNENVPAPSSRRLAYIFGVEIPLSNRLRTQETCKNDQLGFPLFESENSSSQLGSDNDSTVATSKEAL